MKTLRTIPFLFVLLVTSCASGSSTSQAPDAPTHAPTDTPTAIPLSTTPVPTIPPSSLPVTPLPMDQLPMDASAMVARVRQDLAERLSAPPGATMTLLSAEAVDWPDTSLGCPRPNTAYNQMVTPGFIITLLANGGRYSFHTDLADNYVLCSEGQPGNPKSEDGNVQDGWPSQPIDDDLVPPPTLSR